MTNHDELVARGKQLAESGIHEPQPLNGAQIKEPLAPEMTVDGAELLDEL